jgi:anti-sigma regulatory factor (Ser/Thr protein kinase)
MRTTDIAPITQWITAAALEHRQGLPAALERRLGVPRRKALSLLRRLEAAQWLAREGPARRPLWRPGPLRQVVQHYPLDGLLEDLPWRRDFAPCFDLPAPVRRMARHAFTELVNNAIDHSGGTQVTVSMRQTPAQVQLLVSDDGCGLFRRIEDSFDIGEPALAMLELTKGRLTSQPERHCGQGLVVTSHLADVFDLRANAAGFQRRAWSAAKWHGMPPRAALAERPGTAVYLAIALDTQRTLDSVQHALSAHPNGHAFDCTSVALNLIAAASDGTLTSRAEAKRVASRLAAFRRAEIDFAGVDEVGHAFAHELFSVFRRAHPEVELVPLATNPQVASMLGSFGAVAAATESAA